LDHIGWNKGQDEVWEPDMITHTHSQVSRGKRKINTPNRGFPSLR
jgi:hypothetical protein